MPMHGLILYVNNFLITNSKNIKMRKVLLSFALIVVGITLVTSQSIKSGTSNKKMTTNVKVVQAPIVTTNNFTKSILHNKVAVHRNRIAARNSHSRKMSLLRKMHLKHDNHVSNFKSRTPLLRMKASTDTTFYEGFESYNGTTRNWLPTNWTQLNKIPKTAYVVGDSINPTWSINPANDYTDASMGNSMAWVDWDENSKSQDVWLISPAFTPATEDYVNFDFFYNPYWMYFDNVNSTDTTDVFNFKKANATMQMYVSIDNGANWVKLWDAIDDVSQFNDYNIEDWFYSSGSWNTIYKSLAAYAGKSVKIAFRYVGKDGDSMGLDEISVRQIHPAAMYARPQGYFFLGLTTDFRNSQSTYLLGPAYEKAIWNNYSNLDSQSFLWTFADPIIDKATVTSTEIHPEVFYKPDGYAIPTLKAIGGAKDSTYSWGELGKSYFVTGDTSNPLGAGNYDLTLGIDDFQDSQAPGSYFFGTRADSTIDAIANYFEKPVHRYILDSLWVSLGEFSAPTGTEFKLIIRRVNDQGYLADTIATSVCTTADVVNIDKGYNTMLFKGFTNVDSITGLEVINDYLEINDAILVELTGFNKKGITLSAFAQSGDSPTGESNAYVYYNSKDSLGKVTRKLYNAANYIERYTSFLFNLAASYSYLQPDDSIFVAPISGGSKTFKVDAPYSPDNWWLEADLPAWISSDSTFNATTGEITYILKAAALPSEIKGRAAIVKVFTYGADMTINVTQGDYTGLASTKTSNTKVINNGASFELSYSNDYKSVSIYNLAGQMINKFNLSASGRTSIPATNFAKGVIVFKFNGKNTETVKVVR